MQTNRDIGPAVRVFANGPGVLGSIPGRVIPKTLKMELDTTLLNTQHYKVRFKGKVEHICGYVDIYMHIYIDIYMYMSMYISIYIPHTLSLSLYIYIYIYIYIYLYSRCFWWITFFTVWPNKRHRSFPNALKTAYSSYEAKHANVKEISHI